jgi:hypothetical protein
MRAGRRPNGQAPPGFPARLTTYAVDEKLIAMIFRRCPVDFGAFDDLLDDALLDRVFGLGGGSRYTAVVLWEIRVVGELPIRQLGAPT